MGLIQEKIHFLRQQPEHIRLRAVTVMTAVSGVFVFALWAGVLLPLQLKLSSPAPEGEKKTAVAQQDLIPSIGAVSGARTYINGVGADDSSNLENLIIPPEPSASPSNSALPADVESGFGAGAILGK